MRSGAIRSRDRPLIDDTSLRKLCELCSRIFQIGSNHGASRRSFVSTVMRVFPTMHSMHGPRVTLMRNHWRAAIISLLALVMAAPAFADADAERDALARLIHEIEALEPVIATAESQASPDARIRFRYDWLRQDLERIRAGVQEHIDAPRNEPRKVPPLRGDYRQ
ncbi:MAG: RAQPRD family integrative conjugative element protein [Hyphomicrobiaceae bacterium]